MQDQAIPVDVDGITILVEIVGGGGEEEIAGGHLPSFANVGKAVSRIAKEMATAIEVAKPKKATVEFGCDLAMESGSLTTLIVKGSGSASIKIILEWSSS
jgi:Trypsin-co-occurring domain 1